MNRKLFVLGLALLASLLLLVGGTAAAATPTPLPEPLSMTLTGTLNIIFGDPQDETAAPVEMFSLTTDDGQVVDLLVTDAARAERDLYALNGRHVTVAAQLNGESQDTGERAPTLEANSISPAAETDVTSAAITGNRPWISLACKFADFAAEPKTVGYFQSMYSAVFPGLDAYWQEASYGAINLAGSHAAGWFTLPKPKSAYVTGVDPSSIRHSDLFRDCANAADPTVDFNAFSGINVMVNDYLSVYAFGGRSSHTLDGVTRMWPVTWLPPWAYSNISVTMHEMGHAMGLPHSVAPTGTYHNVWDIMSDSRAYCASTDPTFGCAGKHTIAYHRDQLGWIPAERVYLAGPGEHTFTLERTTLPPATGYLMAKVPIGDSGSHFLTLEARQLVGYDAGLPAAAVVIHDVQPRSEPAHLVDPGESTMGDGPWTMWLPGETYASGDGNILVRVESATLTGFRVSVISGAESRTVELSPSDDSYVRELSPNAKYGTASVLKVSRLTRNGPEQLAFVQFNRNQFPVGAYRFRLRLPVASDSGTNLVNLFRVPTLSEESGEPWNEASLTWNNMPMFGQSLAAMGEPLVQPGYHEIDITPVQYMFYGGIKAFKVLPRTGANITYRSKESGNGPRLVIDYLVAPSAEETHTYAPTNDAFVMQAKPKNVFGTLKLLKVRNAASDMNSYVKFNANGLEGTVQQATLRLYVTDPGPDGGSVYATSPYYPGTTTQWLETGLKWNNAPAIGGAPVGVVGNAALNSWVEVDVTQAVIDGLANDNGRVSFGIRNSSTNLVVYQSKEGAHPPELVVVTTP